MRPAASMEAPPAVEPESANDVLSQILLALMELQGRVVAVTGAASGIGWATALLAAERRAEIAAWMSIEARSSALPYMTGEVIPVDGGMPLRGGLGIREAIEGHRSGT